MCLWAGLVDDGYGFFGVCGMFKYDEPGCDADGAAAEAETADDEYGITVIVFVTCIFNAIGDMA